MMLRLYTLMLGAAGLHTVAGSLTDLIGVPTQERVLSEGNVHSVVHDRGTLRGESGVPQSLIRETTPITQTIEDRSALLYHSMHFQPNGEDSAGRAFSAVQVEEKALSRQDAMNGLLLPKHEKNILGSLIQAAGRNNLPVLKKALQDIANQKKKKLIQASRMTLEERIVKKVAHENTMTEVAKSFKYLFNNLLEKQNACQQCQIDCPMRNFKPYGVQTMKECMKHCELAVCRESWEPLAGPYESQLKAYEKQRDAKSTAPELAKSSLFTNYLDDYLKKNGEDSLYICDEADDEYDIVWETRTDEQIEKDTAYDDELRHFDLLEEVWKLPKLQYTHPDRKRPTHIEGLVPSLQPPADELEFRLSMTTRQLQSL